MIAPSVRKSRKSRKRELENAPKRSQRSRLLTTSDAFSTFHINTFLGEMRWQGGVLPVHQGWCDVPLQHLQALGAKVRKRACIGGMHASCDRNDMLFMSY